MEIKGERHGWRRRGRGRARRRETKGRHRRGKDIERETEVFLSEARIFLRIM
jgi:hypothetical protein